jgi:glycosyltransferase involved in cell wall biosynthesis
MIIAIDGTSAKSTGHGMGRYISEMLRALLSLDEAQHYVVFVRQDCKELFRFAQEAGAELHLLGFSAGLGVVGDAVCRHMKRNAAVRHLLHSGKVDVFWGPNDWIPDIQNCARVVTIHDLSTILHPACYPFLRRTYYQRSIRHAARRADRIVAGSESARQEIIRHLRVPLERVDLVYSGGATPELQPVSDVGVLRRASDRYHLPADFLLAIGVPEPKKNLAGVVKALAILNRNPGPKMKLVIGGNRDFGWRSRPVYRVIKDLEVAGDIVFTDYIAEQDLPAVYSLARALVFPSLHEGFGLPIIEAMACGTPVVTSCVSSMPEVAGGAALLVDPHQPSQIADACYRILTDKTLRAGLQEKGLRNAARFSWTANARTLLSVFGRACNRQ